MEELVRKKTSLTSRLIIAFVILFFSFAIIAVSSLPPVLNSPPISFPLQTDIAIEEGQTQTEIADLLKDAQVITSSLYLLLVLDREFQGKFIQAGTYRFTTPLTTSEVAEAITQGTYLTPHNTITLPEGFKANDLYEYLPDSYRIGALDLRSYEGTLFPDTYYISSSSTLEEIITLLTATFTEKISALAPQIEASGLTQKEVIILASIIEREAKDVESKRVVSGILQNRLREDMPLQVDATFHYINGKASHELTVDDLEMDSPFNTYKYVGLPPAPIANPGLESIQAVLSPTETNYFYYLTALDGTFHYAKTFEEHKKNKEKYLR